MCDCWDNMPVVYEEADVHGRKDYTCCECLDPIPKGTLHHRVSGCWPDDGWDTFRQCLECAEWVRHLQEFYKEDCSCINFTELMDHLHYYAEDCEPLLLCSIKAWYERRNRNYLRRREERKRAKGVV